MNFYGRTNPTEYLWEVEIKQELTLTPVLTHYDPANKTILSAEASSYGLGESLTTGREWNQETGSLRARSLTSTEQRHSQIEKEALETTWACEKSSDYILGK